MARRAHLALASKEETVVPLVVLPMINFPNASRTTTPRPKHREALDHEASQLILTIFGGGGVQRGACSRLAQGEARNGETFINSLLVSIATFMVLYGEGRTLLKLAWHIAFQISQQRKEREDKTLDKVIPEPSTTKERANSHLSNEVID